MKRYCTHTSGPDGLPACRHKNGTVAHGEEPTCAFCRRTLGLNTVDLRKLTWPCALHQVRIDAKVRIRAVDIFRAELVNGPVVLSRAIASHNLPKTATYKFIVQCVASGLADVHTECLPSPWRNGRIRMKTQKVLTRLDPITIYTRKPQHELYANMRHSDGTVRAAYILARISPQVVSRHDLLSLATRMGIGAALFARALQYAKAHGMVTRTGRTATYTWSQTPARSIELLPGAPKRIATPGAKRRPPRLAVDVEVMPACDRLDADGVPVAVPTPEPAESAPIVESVTRRPMTTANARSTAALVSTAPVRRVDVAPLLDDDLAAQLRAMLGAP